MKLAKIKYCKNREEIILPLCIGRTVLHLGCADSSQLDRKVNTQDFLHKRIQKEAGLLHGVDNNTKAIEEMISQGFQNIIQDDVESLSSPCLLSKYDVVVAAEIIEHLFNPGMMIDGIYKKLEHNGILIITTPNPISFRFWLHYLFGEEISSPYHNIAFTFSIIQSFLTAKGFTIEVLYGTQPTGHNSFRHRLFRPILDFILKLSPKLGDEMIIIARKV